MDIKMVEEAEKMKIEFFLYGRNYNIDTVIPRNLEKLFAARGRVLIPDTNIVRGKKFSSILSNIFERLDGAGTKLGDWHKFFDDLLSRRNWTTQLWKEKREEWRAREENRQSCTDASLPLVRSQSFGR